MLMTMKSPLGVASLVLAAVTAAGAQTRPDFTGTWVRAADASPSVATAGDVAFRTGDAGSGWGTPLTISQRRDSLIVEYVFFSSYDLQPPIRFAYAMDGALSINSIMLSHSASVQRGQITWRDSSAVITTLHPVPPDVGSGTTEVRQVLTLASPTTLIVETTRPGANGLPLTIRTRYTRR
jgi:hypothetical protein